MMSSMEFDCKLAHSDEIKRISGFNSIKELYERVSQTFLVPTNEILYCTLNTHNFRDMNSLLGNFLSLNDLIVVHMCGEFKDLTIKKTQEYLGLTITDNGHGRAFVKKVKSNEKLIEELIKPGDHIAAINSESTLGMRHYEVAKAIRELPGGANFSLRMIKPLYSQERIANQRLNQENSAENFTDDLKKNGLVTNNNLNGISTVNSGRNNDPEQRQISNPSVMSNHSLSGQSDCSYDDLINSSLPIDRLLSKPNDGGFDNQSSQNSNAINNVQDPYRVTIERINSILESFLGINDNTLAIQIYRLAKENKDSFDNFVKAIESSELRVFNFGEDLETYLWNCALAVRTSDEAIPAPSG